MKKMLLFRPVYLLLTSLVLFCSFTSIRQNNIALTGAWEQKKGDIQTVIIITDHIFSSATYNKAEKKFISSYGGNWHSQGDKMVLRVEWNSLDSTQVGKDIISAVSINKKQLTIEGTNGHWKRLDDGKPGTLTGAWIITGGYNNDQVSKRKSPFFPRRTMKVLSGKYFQWIAYNVVTKQFIDTGGGTYSTENNQYTETIHFFTKTAESVGKTLKFEYSFVNGDWRHKGQKSTGGPMDECWSKRETLEPQQ